MSLTLLTADSVRKIILRSKICFDSFLPLMCFPITLAWGPAYGLKKSKKALYLGSVVHSSLLANADWFSYPPLIYASKYRYRRWACRLFGEPVNETSDCLSHSQRLEICPQPLPHIFGASPSIASSCWGPLASGSSGLGL